MGGAIGVAMLSDLQQGHRMVLECENDRAGYHTILARSLSPVREFINAGSPARFTKDCLAWAVMVILTSIFLSLCAV